MLEHIASQPSLVLVAYGLCLCALLLFSARMRRERTRLRRALDEHLGENFDKDLNKDKG